VALESNIHAGTKGDDLGSLVGTFGAGLALVTVFLPLAGAVVRASSFGTTDLVPWTMAARLPIADLALIGIQATIPYLFVVGMATAMLQASQSIGPQQLERLYVLPTWISYALAVGEAAIFIACLGAAIFFLGPFPFVLAALVPGAILAVVTIRKVRRLRRPLAVLDLLPSLLITMLISAQLTGLVPVSARALEHTFAAGGPVESGPYVQVGLSDGFTYLLACDAERTIYAVPVSQVLGVTLDASAPLPPPTLWEIVTRTEDRRVEFGFGVDCGAR
jgi:hypothetical protein